VQLQVFHQPLDGAPRDRNAFAVELQPDLARAIDVVVRGPDPSDLDLEVRIAQRAW
jgi:hypothetical protein